MCPHAGQARQGVFHAGQCHLEPRLACACTKIENIEDHLLPVDHGEAGEFLPIALLPGRKGLVKDEAPPFLSIEI